MNTFYHTMYTDIDCPHCAFLNDSQAQYCLQYPFHKGCSDMSANVCIILEKNIERFTTPSESIQFIPQGMLQSVCKTVT